MSNQIIRKAALLIGAAIVGGVVVIVLESFNIATLHLGREAAAQGAIAIVGVDQVVPEINKSYGHYPTYVT